MVDVKIEFGDVIEFYDSWEDPVLIISDGPYGLSSFKGDLKSSEYLLEWYEPHIRIWSRRATSETTLWLWCTEVGWANLHPLLRSYQWEYRGCNIWNKGIGHIAGNTNLKTLRKFPVATEVCVQYTRCPTIEVSDGVMNLQEWLRYEWLRTGLPLNKANEACGVRNAATRKYLTKDLLWYQPPPEVFEKLVDYANRFGCENGKPYFSIDEELNAPNIKRGKFHCPMGMTNVWDEPSLHGKERLKMGLKSVHINQKPLRLFEIIIKSSSDEGDMVWEPFGGLCTGLVASMNLDRRCRSAEIDRKIWSLAVERLKSNLKYYK